MVKNFCDCCGREIKGQKFLFNPLIHILQKSPMEGYVYMSENQLFYGVSGRKKEFDVCNQCYNEIYGKAYLEFQRLQKASNG